MFKVGDKVRIKDTRLSHAPPSYKEQWGNAWIVTKVSNLRIYGPDDTWWFADSLEHIEEEKEEEIAEDRFSLLDIGEAKTLSAEQKMATMDQKIIENLYYLAINDRTVSTQDRIKASEIYLRVRGHLSQKEKKPL